MQSQLRDTAERVRPHAAGNLDNAELSDRNALAAAYLHEHPADEWHPITEDWLQSVGVASVDDGSYTVGRAGLVEVVWYPLGVAAEHSSQLCLYLYPAPGILTRHASATRGDLRRLCAAVGVPFPH